MVPTLIHSFTNLIVRAGASETKVPPGRSFGARSEINSCAAIASIGLAGNGQSNWKWRASITAELEEPMSGGRSGETIGIARTVAFALLCVLVSRHPTTEDTTMLSNVGIAVSGKGKTLGRV